MADIPKVVVKMCSCDHEFQDKLYGWKRRLMNVVGKGEKGTSAGTHRCTVCGKIHR